jgi:hypothetical protein
MIKREEVLNILRRETYTRRDMGCIRLAYQQTLEPLPIHDYFRKQGIPMTSLVCHLKDTEAKKDSMTDHYMDLKQIMIPEIERE